jgi:hypothetical protein
MESSEKLEELDQSYLSKASDTCKEKVRLESNIEPIKVKLFELQILKGE